MTFTCAYSNCRRAFKSFAEYCGHIETRHETPALAEYVPVAVQRYYRAN